MDDFRLIIAAVVVVVVVVAAAAVTTEDEELFVDDGTIGDKDERDDEELPVDGGNDKGVGVEKVGVLFEGTKR